MRTRQSFQNFQVDHMTLLVQPQMYNVAFVAFHAIFGIGPDDLLYEKRKTWSAKEGEQSMTFAVRLGDGQDQDSRLNHTVMAIVQPSEPKNQSSHVREMLDGHSAAAHWQHVALRTSDLLAFHKHALDRGVQFITPILKDAHEDLIQVFSGEWFFPGIKASGLFFEFLQRKPSEEHLQKLQSQNRELWFRDKTFLGLYEEKEREYQTGKVTPFLKDEVFNRLRSEFGQKKLWEISDKDLDRAEQIMLELGGKR